MKSFKALGTYHLNMIRQLGVFVLGLIEVIIGAIGLLGVFSRHEVLYLLPSPMALFVGLVAFFALALFHLGLHDMGKAFETEMWEE